MVKLRDYQCYAKIALGNRLRKYGLACCYMKPRTGKTLISLAVAKEYGAKKVLFVTKAKKAVQDSIRKDYEMLSPDFHMDIISMCSIYKAPLFGGSILIPLKREELKEGDDFISYGKDNHCTKETKIYNLPKTVWVWKELKHLGKMNAENISKIKMFTNDPKDSYDLVIVDESHSFNGNFGKKSKRVETAKKLLRDIPMILLSGTPVPETWSNIYNQLSISGNSPFSEYINFYQWAKVYVNIGEKHIGYGQTVNDYGDARIEEIQKIIQPYIVTMSQAEAGFEVKTDFKKVICKIPDHIRDLIKDIKRKGLASCMGEVIIADTSVKRQSKIHQLCGGTLIVNKEEDVRKDMLISDFKVKAIKELAKKYKKFAIFYKFTNEKTLLKKELVEFQVTEDATKFERMEQAVFIGQFVSSREGIKLSTAECLILYNLDFAFVSWDQAKERLQDFNRDSIPIVYTLMSDTGFEEHILNCIETKKQYDSRMFLKTWEIKE